MAIHHRVCVVVVFLFCISGCCCPGPTSTFSPTPTSAGGAASVGGGKVPRGPTDGGARTAGREFAIRVITPLLKAPRTAEFPRDTVGVARLTDLVDGSETANRWRVSGSVDAQNSFGAMLRQNWEVIVVYSDGDYMAGVVRFEGKTVLEVDGYRALVAKQKDPANRPAPPPETPEARKAREDAEAVEQQRLAELAKERRQRELKQAEERRLAEERDQRERNKREDEQRRANEESDAQTMLDFAKREPNAATRAKSLRGIVEKYPASAAAAEAKKLLAKPN